VPSSQPQPGVDYPRSFHELLASLSNPVVAAY
jgi:hypothetical protein